MNTQKRGIAGPLIEAESAPPDSISRDLNQVLSGLMQSSEPIAPCIPDEARRRDRICREIAQLWKSAERKARGAVAEVNQIGRLLQCLKVFAGHGNWQSYFEQNIESLVGFKFRQAQRYMRSTTTTSVQITDGSNTTPEPFLLPGKAEQRSEVVTRQLTIRGDLWLTPPVLLDPVHHLLRKIDTDPCSEASERKNVPADKHFTAHEDGLAPENAWSGRVFINRGQADATPWIQRAKAEFKSKAIEEAILLLPAETDAPWASLISELPRAFIRERPLVATQLEVQPDCRLRHPLMLVHVAKPNRVSEFTNAFSGIADVFVPTTKGA